MEMFSSTERMCKVLFLLEKIWKLEMHYSFPSKKPGFMYIYHYSASN